LRYGPDFSRYRVKTMLKALLKQYISSFLRAFISASFLVIFPCGLVLAEQQEEASNYQNKLERLQKSIKKVQKHLKSTRHKRGNVVTELRKLESEISKNALKLQKTGKKVRQLDVRIDKLKKELRKLNKRLRQQQLALSDQLRAAYALGAQQQLKMLLNQQDPSEAGRLQVYFDYLNRARTEQISQFEETIISKQKLESEVNAALATQQANLQSQKSQKKQLNKQRRTRNKLLATLEQRINNQEQTLSDLESSRNRIEGLLKSLGELLADIPAGPGDKAAFETRKGKLPWPLKGRFKAKFGQSKQQGDLKWNGVLIASQYGEPVKAISRGRVAFSDWLQGFGFITIVDHGNGYMTLYGHNETLLKQAGDWVESGEVIATVGDSGGHASPGLYFEIRERGKPVNPGKWCSLKVRHKG